MFQEIITEDTVQNYPQRKVAKDKVDGVEVSTAWTSDEGYETAILDSLKVIPVERYQTLREAKEGHLTWVNKVKDLEKVEQLEYRDILTNKVVNITR